MSLYSQFITFPVGTLKLVASDKGLLAVLWQNEDPRRVPLPDSTDAPNDAVLQMAAAQLNEYFANKRTAFTLPLDMRGTPFQLSVWETLRGIPFGETRTYGQLAIELGRPAATRAIGAANGRNPLSIVVPCHRVIGASGKLTGFAGDLAAKSQLLAHEGRAGDLFSGLATS